MKRSLSSIFLSLTVISCSARPHAKDCCQQFVDKITALQNTAVWGSDFTVPEFDLNGYLSAFDKLTLRAPGMKPTCFHPGINGSMQIFLLPCGGFVDLSNPPSPQYVDGNKLDPKFEAEDSPEGYFQLAIWREIGTRFALHWHAGYDLEFVVCTGEALSEAIKTFEKGMWGWKIDDAQRKALGRIDPTPVIEMDAEKCTVRIVVAAPFGGIYAITYTISRAFPHTIGLADECLFEHRSTIMF